MELRRLTIYEVLQAGFTKTFKHFWACLKGLLGVALMGLITLVGFALINWSLVTKFILQLPSIMEQAQACGDNAECLKVLVLSLGLTKIHLIIFTVSLIAIALIFSWLAFGMLRYYLNVYDKGTASIKDLFLPIGMSVKLMIAILLFLLIILGGLVLLIVPGIYWMVRFSQFGYFIIDKNAGIIESLKMSWAVTDGYSWQVLALTIIIGIIGALGSAFALFMIVTTPMQFLMRSCMYRKLTSARERVEEVINIIEV